MRHRRSKCVRMVFVALVHLPDTCLTKCPLVLTLIFDKATTRVLPSCRLLSTTHPRRVEKRPVSSKDVLLLSAAASLLMSAAVILQSSLSPDALDFFLSFS